jgi:hypothetical protein
MDIIWPVLLLILQNLSNFLHLNIIILMKINSILQFKYIKEA